MNYTPFIYLAVFAIIVWVIWVLLKRVGIIQTRVEKQIDKEVTENVQKLANSNFFDPDVYKESSKGLSVLVPSITAERWATLIESSWGWFNDDESKVYSVFREMTDKLQISQTADAYYQLFGKDLLGDIESYFNDKEKSFLWKIIDKMPYEGSR